MPAWRGGTTTALRPNILISSPIFGGCITTGLPIPEADFENTGSRRQLSVVTTHNEKLGRGRIRKKWYLLTAGLQQGKTKFSGFFGASPLHKSRPRRAAPKQIGLIAYLSAGGPVCLSELPAALPAQTATDYGVLATG
jgi:hypothetical protein